MGSQTPYRQRSLCHFLLNQLECLEIDGLEWVNRHGKLFKIPWIDKRIPIWGNVRNDILKKWEIYNGRYKEGQSENWTDWKQTFRGALNKSPYVLAVPEMHELKNSEMPFKVYRFTDDVNIHNPDFPIIKAKKRKTFQKVNETLFSPHSNSNSNASDLPANNPNSFVPQVVLDELYNENLNTNNDSPCPQTSPSSTSQSPPDDWDMDFLEDALDQNPTTYCANQNYLPTVVSPDMAYLCNVVPDQKLEVTFNPPQMHRPIVCPTDLTNVCPTNLPNVCPTDLPNACPTSLPNVCPTDLPNACPTDLPIMQFQAFYLNKEVLQGLMGNNGVRFSFGSESLVQGSTIYNLNPKLMERVKGPDYFQQVEFPDIMQCQHIKDSCDFESLKSAQNVLKNLTRGILLFSSGRNLYAYRLCKTRVFASYNKGNYLIIERKNKSEQLLFDMEHFERELQLHKLDPQNVACPSPTVILSFGKEFTHGTQPLVHLELTVLEAEKMLRREMHEKQDIQISGFDSVDLIVEKLNELYFNSYS